MTSPTPEDDELLQSFSISLTIYLKIKKTSVRGKMTSKEEKSMKTKELLFAPNPANYVKFLQVVLLKHGLQAYEVTTKKHFPLKQWLSDAIDIVNVMDYREMVKKILKDKPPMKLPQGLKLKGSGSSEGDSEVISDDCKKAYKNENDEGLTYVSPLGPMSLMPTMVCDWCLALEDGQATIAVPPNIESFNMANKVPILHPVCKATAQPASPAAADLNSLTLAILLQTLAQLDSGFLHSPTAPPTSVSPTSAPPVPQTPTWQQEHTMSLPPVSSPSQLECYL
ncbi:hypothetical protein EDC04DRAFT_2607763 [Pisolithus marmoratus]|nr:hypothetical protein EDC04DRAFT_2607763 [Pisolithus marmoratus]